MPNLTNVLVIEDDPADAEYLLGVLFAGPTRRFNVDCAQHLEEALARIATGRYDIVLADLFLPDSQGLETFFQIKKCSEGLPTLVLTGLNDEQTALEALRQGAQDYLVKGKFNGPFLIKAIQYAIERNKITRDLTHTTKELNQANDRLNQLAHKDPLTDLLNRRGLQEVLPREVAWAQRNGTSIMVLIIDVDDFKKINDRVGHSTGDGVLKELAARIQRPLRSTDFAARIGGDEFLILLPDTEPAEGVKIAEKVRKEISEKPFMLSSNSLKITASVGVVSVSGPSVSLDDLLSETHNALYQSKRMGKNRVSYDRQKGFGGEKLITVAHPIVNLRNDEVEGYEFLTRLSAPASMGDDEFFRIALETNPSPELDQRCLSASLQKAHSLSPRYRRHINVSPNTIMNVPTGALIAMFQKEDRDEKYCLEISQHQIIGDPSYLVSPLRALKRAGFSIAVENVSFGQNSLESIVLLEPNFLKIDKQYVIGISQDLLRLRPLKRLLKMAESLGMVVIAHGIESRDDLQVLKSAGIEWGQGFLWGEPNANHVFPA